MADPTDEFTWPNLLTSLLSGEDLSTEAARWAMTQGMSGEATPVQLAGFLIALRAKGETVEELRGLADVMLEFALRFEAPEPSIDIVGTGGDRMHSVNISTMTAIVVAATDLTIVKHGNRAASSSSGSADVLEALGVSLKLTPEQVRSMATEVGLTFCFAQAFHPAMRHAAVARGELGVPTAFNMLGPLTNPGQPTFAAVGVADARVAPLIAGVFAGRGRPAAVFRGDDGLDELTIATTSTVWWVRDGVVTELSLDPQAVGVPYAPLEALRGGSPEHNAEVVRRLLAGDTGPIRDAVVLNAGMALAVARGLDGPPSDESLARAVSAGMTAASKALDSGAAAAVLERWVAASAAISA